MRRSPNAKYDPNPPSESAAAPTSKHTPGPWRYLESWVINRPAKHGDHCKEVCDLRTIETSPEERVANGRLIAAAPDLLAALKRIVADWDSVGPDESVPDSVNEDAHWEAARAAIAKAETGS